MLKALDFLCHEWPLRVCHRIAAIGMEFGQAIMKEKRIRFSCQK